MQGEAEVDANEVAEGLVGGEGGVVDVEAFEHFEELAVFWLGLDFCVRSGERGRPTVYECETGEGAREAGDEVVGVVAQRHEDEVTVFCEAVVETRVVVVLSDEVRIRISGRAGSDILLSSKNCGEQRAADMSRRFNGRGEHIDFLVQSANKTDQVCHRTVNRF